MSASLFTSLRSVNAATTTQAETSVAFPKETPVNFSALIRQSHRFLSILFTLTVIANFVAMTQGQPPPWITYSPLLPLFLLMFSGLYLFVLPYTAKRRAG